MMRHEAFDTYSIIKRLTKSGLKEEQAKEIVDAISGGRDRELSHLATKEGLAAVEADLSVVKADVALVKADLIAVKADIAEIKTDLTIEIEKVRREIDKSHNEIIRWFVGMNIATISIMMALFKLFAY